MFGNRIEVNIAGGLDIPLHKMVPVRVAFDSPKLERIDKTVAEQFKNTLELTNINVSEPLIAQVESHPNMQTTGEASPFTFGSDGTLKRN